jgi:hypothetical protein
MKHYGFGVTDKDGNKETELVMDSYAANRFASVLNSIEGDWSDRGPFLAVELFYKDAD